MATIYGPKNDLWLLAVDDNRWSIDRKDINHFGIATIDLIIYFSKTLFAQDIYWQNQKKIINFKQEILSFFGYLCWSSSWITIISLQNLELSIHNKPTNQEKNFFSGWKFVLAENRILVNLQIIIIMMCYVHSNPINQEFLSSVVDWFEAIPELTFFSWCISFIQFFFFWLYVTHLTWFSIIWIIIISS